MSAEIEVKEIPVNISKGTAEVSTAGEGVRIILIENGRVGEIALPKFGEFTFKLHEGKVSHIYREAQKRGLWNG